MHESIAFAPIIEALEILTGSFFGGKEKKSYRQRVELYGFIGDCGWKDQWHVDIGNYILFLKYIIWGGVLYFHED